MSVLKDTGTIHTDTIKQDRPDEYNRLTIAYTDFAALLRRLFCLPTLRRIHGHSYAAARGLKTPCDYAVHSAKGICAVGKLPYKETY